MFFSKNNKLQQERRLQKTKTQKNQIEKQNNQTLY